MITTAYMITTRKCNMNCKYCYEKDREGTMDVKTMNRTIDFLIKNAKQGVFAKPGEEIGVYYFGGEPTLNWPAIKENILYTNTKLANGKLVAGRYFLTNALVLPEDKDFVKTLKENNIKVQVSLDGCKEAHENTRGHFDQIVANATFISKNLGSHVITRMSVTPENLPYAFDSFKAMARLSCTVHLTLVPESPWEEIHEVTARNEFQKIMNFYKKYSIHRTLKFNIAEGCIKGGFRTCKAGTHMAGIDIDGSVYPCHRFIFHPNREHWKMGDIKEGAKRYPNFQKMLEKCEGCGCTICHPCPSQIILGGGTKEPPEAYCRVYRAIQEVCGPVAREVHQWQFEQVQLKFINGLMKGIKHA